MATILTEQTQYVDASGRPLVGGSVYIGDVSADPVLNPKAIFSDRALTAALANPQTLDANGRATNKIWTDGKYSLQVNDINGVQVFQDLDRGESAVTIDILNDITDVITTPANNDTLIITRDEAQSKITYANLLAATDADIADLQSQIDLKPDDSADTDLTVDPDAALRRDIAEAYIDALVNEGTATLATTSGVTAEFNSIPAGQTEMTLLLDGVSLSGTDNILVQLSTGTTYATAGYVSTNSSFSNVVNTSGATAGVEIEASVAADLLNGEVSLKKWPGSNLWFISGYINRATARAVSFSGKITLGGVVDGVRLASSGANTFDAGSAALLYKVRA